MAEYWSDAETWDQGRRRHGRAILAAWLCQADRIIGSQGDLPIALRLGVARWCGVQWLGAPERRFVSLVFALLMLNIYTPVAAAGPATSIFMKAGNFQSALAGTAVAIAPSVEVRDDWGNPVAGVPVVFAVVAGGGTVQPTVAVTTDANGIAAVTSWTLGATAAANTLTATAAGLSGSPVTFLAAGRSAFIPTFASWTGATGASAVGTLGDSQFTVTGSDLSQFPMDMSAPAWSGAPGSATQQSLTFNQGNMINEPGFVTVITFDNPVSNLAIYAASWRAGTYSLIAEDASANRVGYTFLSGNAVPPVSGDGFVASAFLSGIIQFSHAVKTITFSTQLGPGGDAGLTMATLALGCPVGMAGDGASAATACEIATWQQLAAIGQAPANHYRLMNDLTSAASGYVDVAGPTANGGLGWAPLRGACLSVDRDLDDCGSYAEFSGVLDGGAFAVRDLVIHRPDESYVGLFANVLGATIENLMLLNVQITGKGQTGGIAGRSGPAENVLGGAPSRVSRVHVTGSVTGTSLVGGVVGSAEVSTIEQVAVSAAVVGAGQVGGIVGYLVLATVEDSYVRGRVIASSTDVGGIVGYLFAGSADTGINRTYSTAEVIGGMNPGGLVGNLVKASGETPLPLLSASFWSPALAGLSSGAGLGSGVDPAGLNAATEAEMKQVGTFTAAEWDFLGESTNGTADIWAMSVVPGFPELRGIGSNLPRALLVSSPDAAVVGTRVPFTVTRRDALGNPAAPSWPRVVSLSASGLGGAFFAAEAGGEPIEAVTIPAHAASATFYFTAYAVGVYTVTASDGAPLNGAVELAEASDAIAMVTAVPTGFAYVPAVVTALFGAGGSSVEPTLSAGGELPTFAITAPDSLPAGLSIDPATGVVRWMGTLPAGTYSLEITATTAMGAITAPFVIMVAVVEVSEELIIAPIADQLYTGATIEPSLSVTAGATLLASGSDYSVAYSDNVEVGTATATITGRGNYAGAATATFEITFAMPTSGLRLASRGSLVVVLFDEIGGAKGYEVRVSPSDAGWLSQSDADRGAGVTPNRLLRFAGLDREVRVEVFVRGRAGDRVSNPIGPLTVPEQPLGSPTAVPVSVIGRVAEDALRSVEPVEGGFELRFEYVIENEGDHSLPNLWIQAPQVDGAVVRLALPNGTSGRLYGFDVMPNDWYWEGIDLAPAPDGRALLLVVVQVLEAP